MLPKNILVPTDLSVEAGRALDYACELARELHARVHLLNVVGLPAIGVPELGVAISATVMDSMLHDNHEALDKIADAHRGDVEIGEVLLKTGEARDVINATAKEIAADLIVIGTHGRTGLSRALLGSIAETVVRTAPCPVLTIHTHEPS
jgi:nucleotide-binding universal stress UspA family protein